MVNSELIEYISRSLAKGNSIEAIRKKLLETGWKPYQIDEAIKLVHNAEEPKVERTSNKKEKAKKIFLTFIGLVILFAIILFVIIFSSSPRAIADSDLAEGVYLELKEGDSVEFNLFEEVKVFSIQDVGSDYIKMIVGDPFVELNLEINQTNHIDLSQDGLKDLKFILKGTEFQKKVYLFVHAVGEENCIEEWDCTSWSPCLNNTYKERVCVDLNNCETLYQKPDETTSCQSYEIGCEEQGGIICNSTAICNINVSSSLDSNSCCLGSCNIAVNSS